MSITEAKGDIVNILDRQTIKRVRRECERLASEKDLPQFQEFLSTGSHFIVTQKRASIIRGVQEGLANKESPGVILHGAYGSGKTVIMENIALLCEEDQEYEGETYERLRYGDTPIDCITISLERNDTPSEFLHAIFESLVENSDSISSEDLREVFNEKKIDLTIEDLDSSLPSSRRQELIDLYEDPESLEDIARVAKSLTASEAHSPIAWFTSYYRDQEDHYPALYIDEFEQLFRQGVAIGEPYRLKAIVQRMIRKAVSGFDELDHPPYILFANTLALDELKEEFNAERDLIDRITESVSYNIDLSEDETKELFAKLYRLYVIPILADREGEAQEWYDTISSADLGEEGYVYPFTDEALDFALRVVHTFEDKEAGETIVRAFRDYKRILIAFLDEWEGDGPIDLDFLYLHGDSVRDRLRGQVERVDLGALPGEDSIEQTITADFSGATGPQIRILYAVANIGILERTERPVYFTPGQIVDISDRFESRISQREAEELINLATGGPEYFEFEDDRLVFNPDELTGEAAGGDGATLVDQIEQTVAELDLERPSVIELWERTLNNRFGSEFSFENRQNQYLEFDTEGELNYTNKVYFAINPENLPEQLQGKEPGDALEFVIRLGRDGDGELPAKYTVTELGDRATSICENIEDSLNSHIQDHVEDESYNHLLTKIQECYPAWDDDFQEYMMFLKLSLARLAGDTLPEDIRDRTADITSFSLIQRVDSNLTNVAEEYPRKVLGFSGHYAGQDHLTLIYGIKHLAREDELIYQDPNDPSIDVRSFGRVSRTRESGESFRDTVQRYEENETFIEDEDLVPRFSTQSREVLNTIEEELSESDDGLDFEDIIELLFGTSEVENVTRAMVYLLLILGEYWDEYSWVFEDDDDTKIIAASTQLDTRKNQARSTLANAIKIEILDQAKRDEPDSAAVEEFKDIYDQIPEVGSLIALEELVEDFDAEWDFNYGTTERGLREIVAHDVFADTDVASYANTIRQLSELERELVYLIHDDLANVVEQIKEATEVREKQEELDTLVEKLGSFNIEPDLESDDLEIDCLTSIEEYWQSHQVRRNIEEADIAADIERYLNEEIRLERLFDILQSERRGIVPQVDDYDNTKDLETVDEDILYVVGEIQEAVEEEVGIIQGELEELEEYEDRVPEGETRWIRHGRNHLESCLEEVEKSPRQFDHGTYGDHWDEWIRAKSNIEEIAFDENEFEEAVRRYDGDIDVGSVEDAPEDHIDEKFLDLEEDTFRNLIGSLNIDDDSAEELKRSLLKIRVKAELAGSSGDS